MFIAEINEVSTIAYRSAKNAEEFKTFAFFESYFSNYIEGTKFEIEEDTIIYIFILPNLNVTNHEVPPTSVLSYSF